MLSHIYMYKILKFLKCAVVYINIVAANTTYVINICWRK